MPCFGPKPAGHYDVYMDGHYYVYTYVSTDGGQREGLALEEICYEAAHAPGRDARFLSSSPLWKPVTELGFSLVIFGLLAILGGSHLTYEQYKSQ
jgi:hypothetical protein